MPIEYAAGNLTDLNYEPIPDDVLAEIGGLIRAFAEAEDILNLFVCAVAEANPDFMPALISRYGFSKKIQIAAELIAARRDKDSEATKTSKDILKNWFQTAATRNALKCRNVTAHGIYMGVTSTTDEPDENVYVFLTDTAINDSEKQTLGMEARGFRKIDFQEARKSAEHIIDECHKTNIEPIAPFRERRRSLALGDHPKGRRKRQRGQ